MTYLLVVYIDGGYKVANCCHRKGASPEHEDSCILRFLRDKMNEKKLKEALRNSSFINLDELHTVEQQYADEDGSFTPNDLMKMKCDHPEYQYDTGSKILEIIQDHPEGMKLADCIRYATDSLTFCERAYVVDFDTGTFEVYLGENGDRKLTPEDRFFFLQEYKNNGYCGHSFTLLKKWLFSALPREKLWFPVTVSSYKHGGEIRAIIGLPVRAVQRPADTKGDTEEMQFKTRYFGAWKEAQQVINVIQELRRKMFDKV